ncbi:MAG TPA: hypothetical protein VGP52_02745 [Stellaceae bacterium]|jgi:hypothetical protein|nr:hypothetical protein [Stellaceae bacterium]
MQLMVIIMVAGDFLAMSLTTDNVRLGTQALATLIAVYGLLMTPLGWGWALFFLGLRSGVVARDRPREAARRAGCQGRVSARCLGCDAADRHVN